MPFVVLAYKNFAANRQISHIGLGVAAINTAKTLHKSGIKAEVWPVVDGNDLRKRLNLALAAGRTISHVVVSAPWIPVTGMRQLTDIFSDLRFAMNCHSNVGFLQADPKGVEVFRQCMDLQQGTHNFHVSGNSYKFSEWTKAAYGTDCLWLPNLYHLDEVKVRPLWHGGTLRVGIFGATRPLKNMVSAVGAALEMSYSLKAETQIWLNTGRAEGGGLTVLNAAKALVRNIPQVSLVEAGWASWPEFRKTVGHMHVLLSPSYTESFNMVTADGVAEGVPSVVSDAIDWAPKHWKAESDDVLDIAKTGRCLIFDRTAAYDGHKALTQHNTLGIAAWKNFLSL
jgi:hypothetical protein